MGERQKPKKNGREETANSKKNHRIGDFVNVRITEASSATLKGEEVF